MILVEVVFPVDVGECLIGIHNCSQNCLERVGGFDCDCYPGFELKCDGITCFGIASLLLCIINLYNRC